MEVRRHDHYWLVIGGFVWPGMGAMTLGKVVFIRPQLAENHELIRHELVHVEQFRQIGFGRFIAIYLGQYVSFRLRGWPHVAAYRRLTFEVEAVWLTRSTFSQPSSTNPL